MEQKIRNLLISYFKPLTPEEGSFSVIFADEIDPLCKDLMLVFEGKEPKDAEPPIIERAQAPARETQEGAMYL